MKKLIIILTLLWVTATLYGGTAKVNIMTTIRELKINVIYTLNSNSIKLTLPRRARLTALTSAKTSVVRTFNNENMIYIDNTVSDYGGSLTLSYTLAITDSEFYKEDWLAGINEPCDTSVTMTVPVGYKGMVLPYLKREQSGYVISPESKPFLICGKFKTETLSGQGTSLEINYQNRLVQSPSSIISILKGYEKLLGALDKTDIIIITLGSLPSTFITADKSVFFLLNNTSPDEIKRVFSLYWLKKNPNLTQDMLSAYADFYKRALDDSGSVQSEISALVPVPPAGYYENVLSKGWDKKGEFVCDVNGMLYNYALLHFASYTIGLDRFLELTRAITQPAEGVSNKSAILTSLYNPDAGQSNSSPLIQFICDRLLPYPSFNPDLSVKGSIIYRNNDSIPDTALLIGQEEKPLNWAGSRSIDSQVKGDDIKVDPLHKLPQMVFANDTVYGSLETRQEWTAAQDAVYKHRHYQGESFRELLDLKKLNVPAVNAFNIPPDAHCYSAVVRFIAPLNSRLVTGLKEVILYFARGKAIIVADRIRY